MSDTSSGPFLCPAGFPVPEGTKEWVVEKGEPGPKGEKGEPGMTAGARRAVIYLFVLTLLLSGANLLWTSHAVNANQASQAREQSQQQAAARKAAQVVERKLCSDLATMAAIQPPAGSAAANPSRAYEQAEHRAWTGLTDVAGCKGK